ncbi:MAG TPA: hypothetical protein DCY07_03825 [Rhodospirillaceae bacterium]|nr:hypothetical protein [Rhodospirillaceae bacterium]
MTFKSVLIAILITAIGFVGGQALNTPQEAPQLKEETVFERVMRTKTLRCGYVTDQLFFRKDPNTGAFSGIFYDITLKIAEALRVKVEWTQEASYATYNEDLVSNRYDAFCSGVWPLALRAALETYTTPVLYSGVGVWVREDDQRVTKIDQINNENVKIAVIDGEMAGLIAYESFPKAQTMSLPNSTDRASMILNVTTGKADVVLIDTITALEFMGHNPGKIRNLIPDDPIRLFPSVYGFKFGETGMQMAFNTAIQDYLDNKVIEGIIRKHEKYPNSIFRVARPFEPTR